MSRDALYFASAVVVLAVVASVFFVWLWRRTGAAKLQFNKKWKLWAPVITGYVGILITLNATHILVWPQPWAAFLLYGTVSAILGSEIGRTRLVKALWSSAFVLLDAVIVFAWYRQILTPGRTLGALLSMLALQTWWVYKGRHILRQPAHNNALERTRNG